VAVCAGLLFYQFLNYDVLQDDAFISIRYAKNFLDGHGLVFNPGERVEGYTNFLWIMLLIICAKLGFPLIQTARFLGLAFSVGSVILVAFAAYRDAPERDWQKILACPMLLAATGALGYWGGSGLETGFFAFLAAGAALYYLSNPALSLAFTVLAALTRPEGALLAFLIGMAAAILRQKSWKFTLSFWAACAVLMLPYAVFKWLYFGSLLPNPFHAKTGWGHEYLQSGFEYSGLFLKHYGLYGLGVLLPILFWKRLTGLSRFSFLVFLGYALYVVAVGGDVLPAHRFFVPVLGLSYLPFVDALSLLIKMSTLKSFAFGTSVLWVGFVFYWFPRSYLHTTASLQNESVHKMITNAHLFVTDKNAKSFAVSSLGAISYYLMDRKFIDMLGLTEPVVAKNPETIEGLVSTWKERRYNAGYVLSQKPDVILFSTGVKPSGLAERALFLYPDFRQNYRLEFLCGEGGFEIYYRRFQNRPTGNWPDRPARFVNLINEGINQLNNKDYRKGVELLRQALAIGPSDCASVLITLGYFFYPAGFPDSAEVYLKKGMELDGGGSVGRYYYRNLLYKQARYAEAAGLDSVLLQMVPSAAQILPRIPTTPFIPRNGPAKP